MLQIQIHQMLILVCPACENLRFLTVSNNNNKKKEINFITWHYGNLIDISRYIK